MVQNIIQHSFNSGEWSPRLAARVDLTKYNSGAALLKNFFVDYRGGATIRPGTKYIIQAFDSSSQVRLIPFQASVDVGYALEFGDSYIRPIYQGAPVLETGINITGITKANPAVVSVVNTYSVGDVVYISSVSGMTQVNGRYFKISARAGGTITLADLNGTAVNSSSYSNWSSGGTVQRVYQFASPYPSIALTGLKFAQNVSEMILCHPDYPPYILTLNTATSWTLTPITFGSTVSAPAAPTITTTGAADNWHYSYIVTAVDAGGQESNGSTPGLLASKKDIRANAETNTITWVAVPGASSYNVYKSEITKNNPVPDGSPHGFIGNATGVALADSNIGPDYSLTPPMAKNPFVGGNVLYATITTAGTYTTVPTVSFAAGASTVQATGTVVLGVVGTPTVSTNGGTDYVVGEIVHFNRGVSLVVATVDPGGEIQTFQPITYPGSSAGAITNGSTPSNPVDIQSSNAAGTGGDADFVWGVVSIQITNAGIGYTSAPAITFSTGAAVAVATVSDVDVGNPVVPQFFQQRLWFLGKNISPQSFEASQPGSYYNFNISNPIQDDDALSGQLVSGQLNTIKAAVSMQSGLVVLSDRASWLINGGSAGSAVGNISGIVASTQAYNGISDVPPIVANYDILYVQSKGSIVRDLSYSFYTNVFTGADISAISSHLFYGYQMLEWAWAEEPFKVVWTVRNDGVMLSLTFLKEQEFIAWAHTETDGEFKSVCTITEEAEFGKVDAVYTVVERVVNGFTVKYIERFAEQYYPNGVEDAWQVDAGLQYDGAPATSFTGGEHLAGLTVTGLADGEVITPFVMATNGAFTLASAKSKVTVGIGYTADLQSLRVDLGAGQATIQGKSKRVAGLVIRVAETLGLYSGQDFDNLVSIKDLVVGNVSGMKVGETDQLVSDLVDGDAKVLINPTWTTTGQYCVRQTQPLPATILGFIPELIVGDTK